MQSSVPDQLGPPFLPRIAVSTRVLPRTLLESYYHFLQESMSSFGYQMSGSLELRPKQGHREVTVHRGSLEIVKPKTTTAWKAIAVI